MTKIIHVHNHKTALGELIIGSFQDQLCLCDWRYRRQRAQIDARLTEKLESQFIESNSPIIGNCIDQIDSYLSGELKEFDLPLLLVGTDFQQKVWRALMAIPYGTDSSYMQLSKQLNNEKAIRAVANANGANALSIIIPCHRIIGSNGDLVGYAGGIATKKKLLTLENGLSQPQFSLF